MSNKGPVSESIRNALLRRLAAGELRRILPHLQPVSLQRDHRLYEPGNPIDFVYFPEQAVFSALAIMEDGGGIEVGTIGNEGASGVSAVVGAPTSLHRVLVQIPGSALRISADVLGREAEGQGPLRQRLLAYYHYFFAQVSQSVACNGLHTIQKRCCRWLLMTHDRTESDTFPLTQEYLALMLGVRRAGVSAVLKSLQEEELIQTSRGKITVTDRHRLEARSCECYQEVKRFYEQFLG